jgi:hypothetical protein
MDISNIISVIGIIGTWVTIVLVYNTLREMRNQRKASQKPDLLIPKLSVFGYAFGNKDKTNFLTPRLWSSKSEISDFIGDAWEESAPAILYNVGFGVAKNIELVWRVDYDKTIQQIQDYCYQHQIPLVLQVNESDRRLTIIERGVKTGMDIPLFPMKQNFDFLMPVSITKEGISSEIPNALRQLISATIYLKILASRQNRDSKLEFATPTMKVEVHYDDLEDSHYSKTFDVNFSSHFFLVRPFDKTEDELKQIWGGKFEFETTNNPKP